MVEITAYNVTSITALNMHKADEETNFEATRTIRVQTGSGEEIDLVLLAMDPEQLIIRASSSS